MAELEVAEFGCSSMLKDLSKEWDFYEWKW